MTKRVLFILLLSTSFLSLRGQTERGKWLINPQFTAFDLSGTDNSKEKADLFRLGVGFKGGTFIADDLAFISEVGFRIENQGDYKNNALSLGVGIRYYIFSRLFVGAELSYEQQWLKYEGVSHYRKPSYLMFGFEAGYALFITPSFAFEPGLYWKYSFVDQYMQYGLKLGFGVYF